MIRFIFFALLFAMLYLLLFRRKDDGVNQQETEAFQTPPSTKKNQRQSIVPRGSVHVAESGRAMYSYSDVGEPDTHMHQFLDRGLQAGGPTWEALILAAVQIYHPSIEDALDMDPNSDGLTIWSDNKKALDQVAKLVGKIKSDPHFLEACLKHAEEQGYLE